MTSALEIRRQLSAMDETGWALVGLEDEGPGWTEFMWDDQHPKFMREYTGLRELLHEEEEAPLWLH